MSPLPLNTTITKLPSTKTKAITLLPQFIIITSQSKLFFTKPTKKTLPIAQILYIHRERAEIIIKYHLEQRFRSYRMQFANENEAQKWEKTIREMRKKNTKIEQYFQFIADRSGNGMVEASEFCAIAREANMEFNKQKVTNDKLEYNKMVLSPKIHRLEYWRHHVLQTRCTNVTLKMVFVQIPR
jgi:hypothetical protein